MSPATDPAPVRPNPDVLVQRLGPETVLLHLRTNRFFELNRTASRLWELLSEGHARPRIEERLLQEFDVTRGSWPARSTTSLRRFPPRTW